MTAATFNPLEAARDIEDDAAADVPSALPRRGAGRENITVHEPGPSTGTNGGKVATGCILSDYVESAMSSATFDKLDDGTFVGTIPSCQGVVAFGDTLMECQRLLQSTLEDWLLLGLRMGHTVPVLAGLSLNGELAREPLDAV